MRDDDLIAFEGSTATFITGAVVFCIITVVAMVGGLRECSVRSRERFQLQRVFVEKCQGTQEQAERVHPYPGTRN